MINLPLFQVDAFAETPFSGNPAAVVLLSNWLETDTMQNIALENNLSETAFLVCNNDHFDIRYFTPLSEVDLCGHATLASAYVLFHLFHHTNQQLQFNTLNSGSLHVEKKGDLFVLDFPSDIFHKTNIEHVITKALDVVPQEIFQGRSDLLLVFNSEEEIQNIEPDFEQLKKADARGIIVTAPGNDVDFVSRFFAPKVGINEDPVTGSAHTTLIPYWANRLNKKTMIAKQLSKRGGTIYCEMLGERVKIGGKAVHYLSGEITIQE
jgi:PhzF family phenazine biosynthesis protein